MLTFAKISSTKNEIKKHNSERQKSRSPPRKAKPLKKRKLVIMRVTKTKEDIEQEN
jgi:hypothetical protein